MRILFSFKTQSDTFKNKIKILTSGLIVERGGGVGGFGPCRPLKDSTKFKQVLIMVDYTGRKIHIRYFTKKNNQYL